MTITFCTVLTYNDINIIRSRKHDAQTNEQRQQSTNTTRQRHCAHKKDHRSKN